MTLTVTTDHALVRKTILDWFKTYSGAGEVIYLNQETPRPDKPYGTILILNNALRFGLDEEREVFDAANNVIQRTTAGPRQIIAQCEIYSDPATVAGNLEAAEMLENALTALDTVPVQDAFRAAKIGLLNHGLITRLDEQLGDRWERRAAVDVTFLYSGETFDDGLTGESGNWVETVEDPTEANGNATYNE